VRRERVRKLMQSQDVKYHPCRPQSVRTKPFFRAALIEPFSGAERLRDLLDDGSQDGSEGVRVWKDRCQAVACSKRPAESDRKASYQCRRSYSILGFPHSGAPPATLLSLDVAKYDEQQRDPELRAILMGWVSSEEAIEET
jgi:hypothetical protein